MDERDVVLARERRELATLGARDEPRDLEVARVYTEDRPGLLVDRAGVVACVSAVGGADLDELRARAPQHVRDAEAAADLDQLAARDDDLLARREGREGEQDRSGVVVHHDRILGGREVGKKARRVPVPFPALSSDEVVFDAHRTRRGRDGGERARRERSAAEIGLQDDAGRVDDAAKGETLALREGRARLRREGRGIA